jgi:hypothetical protein
LMTSTFCLLPSGFWFIVCGLLLIVKSLKFKVVVDAFYFLLSAFCLLPSDL